MCLGDQGLQPTALWAMKAAPPAPITLSGDCGPGQDLDCNFVTISEPETSNPAPPQFPALGVGCFKPLTLGAIYYATVGNQCIPSKEIFSKERLIFHVGVQVRPLGEPDFFLGGNGMDSLSQWTLPNPQTGQRLSCPLISESGGCFWQSVTEWPSRNSSNTCVFLSRHSKSGSRHCQSHVGPRLHGLGAPASSVLSPVPFLLWAVCSHLRTLFLSACGHFLIDF